MKVAFLFWELYDGQQSAGVTVHFIDEGLDTGDVAGVSEVPIHPKETPESLRRKLDLEGARLLVRVVDQIEQGTVDRQAQAEVVESGICAGKCENTSLFDIPRMGVSSDHSPLALLMELEGISWANLRRAVQRSPR
jgi:hypothetical protein